MSNFLQKKSPSYTAFTCRQVWSRKLEIGVAIQISDWVLCRFYVQIVKVIKVNNTEQIITITITVWPLNFQPNSATSTITIIIITTTTIIVTWGFCIRGEIWKSNGPPSSLTDPGTNTDASTAVKETVLEVQYMDVNRYFELFLCGFAFNLSYL